MRIGPHELQAPLLLAPMAGVSDPPFRRLCMELGAGLTVGEMVSADPSLRASAKTRARLARHAVPGPRVVQIVGADPGSMAEAARYVEGEGADIVDINMGCPARKVCRRAAGSALLADEPLVGRILHAVVRAVRVPVTLKIRTGPEPGRRNAVRIARIAEAAGVQALVVHGRTRACGFRGEAEHRSVRAVKEAVGVPVVANGDIATPARARAVLRETGADAVMVGRAAQGNPWLFRDLAGALVSGRRQGVAGGGPGPATLAEQGAGIVAHLEGLHELYAGLEGDPGIGVRTARKHLKWYAARLPGGAALWRRVQRVEEAGEQLAVVRAWLRTMLGEHGGDRALAA